MVSSRADLQRFPEDARRDAGFQLHSIQIGQEQADWKPMNVVGAGAMEIRIHRAGEWRIIFAARFESAVYVLHAFEKKTQKTRQSDLALAKARYKEIENHEKSEKEGKD